jgi:RHS repeat-associated protein
VTVTVHNPLLSGGQESATYTVLTGDTAVTTAAGLAAAINADTHLQAIEVTATNKANGTLAFSEAFSASALLASGGNVPTVSATDGANNTKTNLYQVPVTSVSSTNLTFDVNGNMTSDGTNSYVWDCENRLIQVTYPGTNNYSQFTYDPFSGLVKIVETSGGSITSTKQFVRCGSQICEERNASSVITKQFFGWGQTLSGTNYYYCRNIIDSVTDVSDPTGTIVAHYEYDPYGQVTQTVGTLSADFQYAGYYFHPASGLNLTTFRAYSPSLGRWINRDPIEEKGGLNLYGYVENHPISDTDPSGLYDRDKCCKAKKDFDSSWSNLKNRYSAQWNGSTDPGVVAGHAKAIAQATIPVVDAMRRWNLYCGKDDPPPTDVGDFLKNPTPGNLPVDDGTQKRSTWWIPTIFPIPVLTSAGAEAFWTGLGKLAPFVWELVF